MSSHRLLVLFCLITGCGGTVAAADDAARPSDTIVEDAAIEETASSSDGDSSSSVEVGSPPAEDSSAPIDGDSGVTPQPCVGKSELANDLPHDASGALEGDLVAIHCPGDSDHLHLQVAVGTKRYDIAIPVYDSTGRAPIGIYTKDLASGSAAPGWSNAKFSYASDLGVHSTDFTMLDRSGMLAKLQSELQYAHVSIHGKSYTDGTGVHDVHYTDGSHDGVVLLRGRGAGGTDHAIAVRYSTASF